jgi:predicted nucleic acid-binding protein
VTVLPDTSIWVDYFRGTEPTATALDRMLADEEPVMCGPILAELLAGAPPSRRDELWLALASLPFAESGRDAWAQAGELAQELRSRGGAVPLLDILIAVAAVRANAALWTRDRDFERVAAVLPELELHRRVR